MTNFGYAEIGYLTRLKRREIKDQVRTRDKFWVRREGVSDEAETWSDQRSSTDS